VSENIRVLILTHLILTLKTFLAQYLLLNFHSENVACAGIQCKRAKDMIKSDDEMCLFYNVSL